MAKTFMRWDFAEHPPVATTAADATIEPITDDALPAIAHLMVDGYRGTIDFDGEDEDDALEELRGAVDGANGPTLREAWLVAKTPDGESASAICCIRWQGMPFISYVFTAASEKRKGYAGRLIEAAAARLAEAGERELTLFVTVGNPARSLYERLGLVKEPAPDE